MPEKPSPLEEVEPLTRTQILIAIGVTAILLLVLATLWRRFGAVALMSWHLNWQDSLFGVGLGVGISAVSALVYRLWPAYRQSANFYLDLVLKPLFWTDILWLGLLPGMSEELLFRGVMLPAFGFGILGLVVSSLCFGILHMSNLKQWPYMIWATTIGLVLGFSAIATNNLLVPMVAHVFTNILSGSIWKFSHANGKREPS